MDRIKAKVSQDVFGPQDTTSFQDDLNLLSNWIADNLLTVNALKPNFMFISCSHRFNFPPLLLNGSKLEKVSCFKYLGVWISDDFLFQISSHSGLYI